MDIANIGMDYLNSAYLPFSASDTAVTARNSQEKSSFEDILKRVENLPVSKQAELPSAGGKTPIDKNDKLYELCMELETFLIKNLIKSMRSTVQKTNLIDTGFAGGVYEDMLYDEYAKSFSRNANFGFAEMAYRELAGIQKT